MLNHSPCGNKFFLFTNRTAGSYIYVYHRQKTNKRMVESEAECDSTQGIQAYFINTPHEVRSQMDESEVYLPV